MKINASTILKSIDDTNLIDGDAGGKPMTFGAAASSSLLRAMNGASPEQAMDRWELARTLRKATGEVEITTEQASMIKQCVAAIFPPLVSGPVARLIEGKD